MCGFSFFCRKLDTLVTVIGIPDCILVVKMFFPVTLMCKQTKSSVFKREVKKKKEKGKLKQGAMQLFLLLFMQKDKLK